MTFLGLSQQKYKYADKNMLAEMNDSERVLSPYYFREIGKSKI